MPKNASAELTDLLSKLLEKDPKLRLGNSKNIILDGSQDVMDHKWFKNLNWDGLYNKQVKPPIIPIIKNEFDVSNFDKV